MDAERDTLEPMRKRMMEHVNLEKSTSLFDQVYLRCIERNKVLT